MFRFVHGREEYMARVTADAVEIQIVNENGITVDGLEVTCAKCGHTVEVYGTHQQSAKRGGVMLSEDCLENERNFYVVYGVDLDRDDEPDEDDDEDDD
jgi:hypothetical protein